MFVHVSAEDVLGFDAEALATLTKFPIVTIEKWQGCRAPGYTTEEAAMLAAAQSIKEAAAMARTHVSVVVRAPPPISRACQCDGPPRPLLAHHPVAPPLRNREQSWI